MYRGNQVKKPQTTRRNLVTSEFEHGRYFCDFPLSRAAKTSCLCNLPPPDIVKENRAQVRPTHQTHLKPVCATVRSSSAPKDIASMKPKNRKPLVDLSTNSNSSDLVNYTQFANGLRHPFPIPSRAVNGPPIHSSSSCRSGLSVGCKKPADSQFKSITSQANYCSKAGSSAAKKYVIDGRYKSGRDKDYKNCYSNDDVFIDGQGYTLPGTGERIRQCSKPLFNMAMLEKYFHNISPIKKNLYTAETTILLASSVKKVTYIISKKQKKKKTENDRSRWMHVDIYNQQYLENVMDYLFKNDMKFPLMTTAVASKFMYKEARERVIDWILQVQVCCHLSSETYLKAIRIFDSILLISNVAINMYQLIGITCLWISSKYTESFGNLTSKQILSFVEGGYVKEQLFVLERKVLKFMNYNCNVPEPISFAEYYIKKMNIANKRVNIGCYYLLELFTLCIYFSTFPSSHLAATAVYLAMKYLGENLKLWAKLFCHGDHFPIEYLEGVLGCVTQESYPYKWCYKKYLTEENAFIPYKFIASKK